MKILVLNSGSSSQKACLYEITEALPENPPPCLWEGKIEFDGAIARATVKNFHGIAQQTEVEVSSRAQAVEHLLGTLWSGKTPAVAAASDIDVVGHRVVHGGPQYEQPVLITAEVKAGIASVSTFAPLHNRAELEGVGIIEKLLGLVPQIAVFDTGFHRKMPLPASVYPGPYEWFESGCRSPKLRPNAKLAAVALLRRPFGEGTGLGFRASIRNHRHWTEWTETRICERFRSGCKCLRGKG
jgi:acetate kinase